MVSEKVLICCRLPNGFILEHPQDKSQRVTLRGTYGAKTLGGLYAPPAAFSTTEVDAELWAAWKAAHVGYAPLKTRAIFEARNVQEAAAKARELEKEKTGFEPAPQNAPGIAKAVA